MKKDIRHTLKGTAKKVDMLIERSLKDSEYPCRSRFEAAHVQRLEKAAVTNSAGSPV